MGNIEKGPALVGKEADESMKRINGMDFCTVRELAELLGYSEVQIGAFGIFCKKVKT